MKIPEMIQFYAPISKIDEERRMVFGYATTPTEDSQEEIVDLQASFEAVDDWKKWANIKEMHKPDTAVGIAPIIEKHTGVGVYIGAEIVDDQAWKKCVKKVYKGFSIGGKVLERDGKRITKYQLMEISLVDRPANPDAIFMVAKRDASAEAGGDPMPEEMKKDASSGASEEKPKAEAEAKGEKVEEKKETETEKPAETEKSEGAITMSKAEFDKLQERLNSMEKMLSEKKEQDTVTAAILKAVEKLEPQMKKLHEEIKPKTGEEKIEEAKAVLSKKSVGELTKMMLNAATEVR